MTKQQSVSIEPSGLRVEFQGIEGPTHFIVPVLFRTGRHRDIRVKIRPREDVTLSNSVIIGDALQDTFARQHSISVGGSFMAEASYSYAFGRDKKAYEVVWLADFRGLSLQIEAYDVKREPIGLQFAFPIVKYEDSIQTAHFAEVTLEVGDKIVETHYVPQVVHPNAGRVLLLSGYSPEFHTKVFGHQPASQIAGLRRMYLTATDLQLVTLDNMRQLLLQGFDGVHLYTNVDSRGILVGDKPTYIGDFFDLLNGLQLKFLYIDTCNSVGVVSMFRKTDIGALIAATQNLEVQYANGFEKDFYDALGKGSFISQSFQRASEQQVARAREVSSFGTPTFSTRSGIYNPMFLDLRVDSSFRPQGK